MSAAAPHPSPRRSRSDRTFWLGAILCAVIGLLWLIRSSPFPPEPSPRADLSPLVELRPGAIASMDSPALSYSPGWSVTPAGADPHEPADPWQQPAGAITFCYSGRELALALAPGDYWGYLYITVDGEPANLLPTLPNNADSEGNPAAYRTLYAPERQTAAGPTMQWVIVHRAVSPTPCHAVRVEIWRSWGQTPVRGVAVDAIPAPPVSAWPAIALLSLAGWLAWQGWSRVPSAAERSAPWQSVCRALASLFLPQIDVRLRLVLAAAAVGVIVLGVTLWSWSLSVLGTALLAWTAVPQPALWTAALLFALPFYYAYDLPLLWNRAVGMVEAGLLGGLVVLAVNRLLFSASNPTDQPASRARWDLAALLRLLLVCIVAWALIATFAAGYFDLALREWRTVFLAAGLFAILLAGSLTAAADPRRAVWTMVGAWLAGGSVVALAGLWQYASDQMLITAEGVSRIRAFYGSPNNLALYLERTLAVTLALALYAAAPQLRGGMAVLVLLQGAALLLTFSKGALLLGLPALIGVLALGGLLIWPPARNRSRAFWWLAAVIGLILAAILPFAGTERFQRLLDFSQGTGFLRLQLWRSAWQMALDHLLLGVGPDNFLYVYRSEYLLPTAWQEPNLNHPHDWLLDWWTRLGLPGLLLAVAWFTIGCVLLWRTARQLAASDRSLAALALGLLAACAAGLAHGLIDASYALPDLMLVWVFVMFVLPLRPDLAETFG